MTLHPSTFLTSIFISGLLLFTSPIFADNYFSLTQSHMAVHEVDNNLSAKQVARQQFENVLFGNSIDRLLKYDLGANKSTGSKVHSSVGLKLRSDETVLQFKMTF